MKQALRATMRERRNTISPLLYAEKSTAIREKLENNEEFKNSNRILIYVSKKEEVDTHEILEKLFDSGKEIFAPKVDGEELRLCKILSMEDLAMGSFGVLEPKSCTEMSGPNNLDCILVPGLAFTKNGDRIGYGKGYYDVLLNKTNAHKIGLAFEEQIVDEVPLEDHDARMNVVITDQSIYHH
jgi:5-formyltetrahydrofolate cyclo-ligase